MPKDKTETMPFKTIFKVLLSSQDILGITSPKTNASTICKNISIIKAMPIVNANLFAKVAFKSFACFSFNDNSCFALLLFLFEAV